MGRRATHGMYGTPTYISWCKMKERCLNTNSLNYHKYGGDGVTVSDDWLTFENFYRDMGVRPDGCSLNRINGSKVYSKDTCEWATLSVQAFDQKVRRTNKSGQTGVYFREREGKWLAQIRIEYKLKTVYWGSSYDEACEARKRAEVEYFGFVKNQ